MAHAFNNVPTSMFDFTFSALGPDAQRIEWTFRTSPHRATEGLFRLPFGYIEEDIGMDRETARAAIEEVVAKRPFRYDFDAAVVLDLHALRNNPIKHKRDPDTGLIEVDKNGRPKTDKRLPGAIARLRALPHTPLLPSLYEIAAVDSPDFAEAMAEHFHGIDLGAPLDAPSEAPSEPLASPSDEAPSDAPSQGPWQGTPQGTPQGASREETSRAEASSDEESRVETSARTEETA